MKAIFFKFSISFAHRKGDFLSAATQQNYSLSRERKTGTVCAPVASQLMKTASNAIRLNSTQLNQQQVCNAMRPFHFVLVVSEILILNFFHCACAFRVTATQQQNQKTVNAFTSHNNAGSAENQQPLIDDNHLQKLSKTGSFLSHLAREFSGGRASSSAASDLPAMKSSSRNNSSGSNNSSGAAGRRIMRKQQQHSCSESSVGEEAREIDDVQTKAAAATPPATINATNETSNEIESKMVGDEDELKARPVGHESSNTNEFTVNENRTESQPDQPSAVNQKLEDQTDKTDKMLSSNDRAETSSTVESQDTKIAIAPTGKLCFFLKKNL